MTPVWLLEFSLKITTNRLTWSVNTACLIHFAYALNQLKKNIIIKMCNSLYNLNLIFLIFLKSLQHKSVEITHKNNTTLVRNDHSTALEQFWYNIRSNFT